MFPLYEYNLFSCVGGVAGESPARRGDGRLDEMMARFRLVGRNDDLGLIAWWFAHILVEAAIRGKPAPLIPPLNPISLSSKF